MTGQVVGTQLTEDDAAPRARSPPGSAPTTATCARTSAYWSRRPRACCSCAATACGATSTATPSFARQPSDMARAMLRTRARLRRARQRDHRPDPSRRRTWVTSPLHPAHRPEQVSSRSTGVEVHAILTIDSTGDGDRPSRQPGRGRGSDHHRHVRVDERRQDQGGPGRRRDGRQTLRDGVHFAVIAGTDRRLSSTRRPALVRASAADPGRGAAGHRPALRRRRHLDGRVAGAGRPRCCSAAPGRDQARDPDDRRPEQTSAPTCSPRAGPLRGPRSSATASASARLGARRAAEGRRGAAGQRSTSSGTRATWPTSSAISTETSMSKTVADVAMRVWVPQTATLQVRQAGLPRRCRPDRQAHRRQPADRRLPDRRVGRRGPRVPPVRRGAARRGRQRDPRGWVKLLRPDTEEVFASGNVLAQWTDDLAQSTRINGKVAHYTGQAELHELIQDGLQRPRGRRRRHRDGPPGQGQTSSPSSRASEDTRRAARQGRRGAIRRPAPSG